MTDFRALCAELTEKLDEFDRLLHRAQYVEHPLTHCARAALAEPQPEPPTDEDLEPSSTQIGQLQSGLEHCFSKASAKEYLRVWVRDYARAVLARWGTNQELEACCEWLQGNDPYEHDYPQMLRTARRPKPPSLKQQALEALQRAEEGWRPIPDDCDTIRRALEALPDD